MNGKPEIKDFNRLYDRELLISQPRLRIITAAVLIFFSFLVCRLLWLQVIEFNKYQKLSEQNIFRKVPIRAFRGNIYDRDNRMLATNIPVYTVSIILADLHNNFRTFERLGKILNMEPDEISNKLSGYKYRIFEPVRIKENVDWRTIARIEEQRQDLPGVVIQEESQRKCLMGEFACHVIGYVGETSEPRSRDSRSVPGNIAGQMGVESFYDDVLRGQDGYSRIRVSASGFQIEVADKKEPVTGQNLFLTVDRRIQEKAEQLLRGYVGSAIVMVPANGEILALVCSPGFNLNDFNGGMSLEKWQRLCNDRRHPLLNRAVAGLYPPGSTFKLITATAGLSEKVVGEHDLFECSGIYNYSTWSYKCWQAAGHGKISIIDALKKSCDIYFYQLGLKVRADRISEYAVKFGLGQPTGIDLLDEKGGLVPTTRWKEDTYGIPWFPGNTIQYSIGQSYLLCTPLQMLQAFNMLGNEGVVYRPHLLRTEKPEISCRVELNPEIWRLLKKGMYQAVNETGGTGWRAKIPGLEVTGKTATIQNPHGKNHASFIAFAPCKKPRFSVIVFLEQAGEGGRNAAPIARQILETCFGVPDTAGAKDAPEEVKNVQ